MKYSISTEIKINASASKIWEVLTDIENYPNWNPFITDLSGDMKVGGRLRARIDNMTFKPTILTFDKEKEFKWIGRLLFPGLFDGEHRFEIIDNGDGSCRFVQSEKFNGFLVGLMKKKLEVDTKNGFDSMNQALKKRCETFFVKAKG